jgi:hypothetical protein
MVALDNSAIFGSDQKVPRLKFTLAPLVGGIALLAVALVLGAVVARGFGENGLRLGSQLAWRYACLVFFAALACGPVCRIANRLFQTACPESLSRRLVWGFCISYGVYLLSVFLPNVIQLSAGATLMVLFGGTVAVIMAATVAPITLHGRALIGEKTRRTMLATATIYFWLCYALMALARISGPHRPDVWYGFSLSLMVTALLLRYADRWFGHRAQKAPIAI